MPQTYVFVPLRQPPCYLGMKWYENSWHWWLTARNRMENEIKKSNENQSKWRKKIKINYHHGNIPRQHCLNLWLWRNQSNAINFEEISYERGIVSEWVSMRGGYVHTCNALLYVILILGSISPRIQNTLNWFKWMNEWNKLQKWMIA